MGTERGGEFPGDPIIYEGNPPRTMYPDKEAEMNGMSVLDETPRRDAEERGLDVDRLLAVEKKGEEGPIEFICTVWKVSTTADGGIRIVLDTQESTREHMPFLAQCQQNDIALEIEAKKVE